MSVLMLYNLSLVYTMSAIQSQTGIELSTLVQILQILLKAKVLKIVSPDSNVSSEPNDHASSADNGSPNVTVGSGTTGAQTNSNEENTDSQLTPDTHLALYTDYKK